MTDTLHKVVRPGTVPTGRRRSSVFAKIDYDGERLSIVGVVGPTAKGNSHGGAGQIVDELDRLNSPESTARNYAPGWNGRKVHEFAKVWRDWHLNDMRAGCEHQRAMGWTYDEHPSEPCPVCGYKFGTQWLKEDVPDSVIAFLKSLPETDRAPAWV